MTDSDNLRQFYLNCPIGFEFLLKQEIQLKHGHLDIQIHKGGVLVNTELSNGLNFNHTLKIPTRVLLRIKEQKCRDLPKLYKILKKINWKEYLKQENIEFKVSAHKSRLIHTSKIEQTAISALNDYFKANQIKESIKLVNVPNQLVFLRIDEDHLTISLDTSGKRLDERVPKRYRGHASIRETYASALLLFLLEDKEHQYNLLDPMCGSCTFLIEAKNFWQANKSRTYSYQNWISPSISSHMEMNNLWKIRKFTGVEQDKEVHHKIENKMDFTLFQGNAFKRIDHQDQIIISNPPYGKRIKIKNDRKSYFNNLIATYQKNYTPKKMGLIIPFDIAKDIKCERHLSFNQNGIKVSFLVI